MASAFVAPAGARVRRFRGPQVAMPDRAKPRQTHAVAGRRRPRHDLSGTAIDAEKRPGVVDKGSM